MRGQNFASKPLPNWIVVFIIVLAIGLACILSASKTANGDEGLVSKVEALCEMVRLHNAGLYLGFTLSEDQLAAKILPDGSQEFLLEEDWEPTIDGSITFIRGRKKVMAVELNPTQYCVSRLKLACAGQEQVSLLLNSSEPELLACGFASALVPEVAQTEWRISSAILVPEDGYVTISLCHKQGRAETTVRLGLNAIERDLGWRLEAISFYVERR